MDSFDNALALGHQNRQALDLLRNHCRHAKPTVDTSPVGQMVGLPIGRAEISCEHAPFFGMSTVDLTALAVEFYERNCDGCQYRSPTGQVPTIVSEVERRRAEREAWRAQAQQHHEQELEAWTSRRIRRAEAMLGQPYAVRDLAEKLATFDTEPGVSAEENAAAADARRAILETARQAPQFFHQTLINDLIVLAKNRDATALEALRALAEHSAIDKAMVASAGARVLAGYPISEAGKIVSRFADRLDPEEISTACYGAMLLASDADWSFAGPHPPAEPDALLALSRVLWSVVLDALREMLGRDDGWSREVGCHAARHLIRDDPARILDLGEILIRSIREIDSGYAGRAAPGAAAARALAEGCLQLPQEGFHQLEGVAAQLSDDQKQMIMRVPRFILHDDRELSEAAMSATVRFCISRLDGTWGSECAADASDELRWIARSHPSDLLGYADALLGAMLDACLAPPPSSVILPEDMNALHVLQRQTESVKQSGLRWRLAETLGLLARGAPEPVLSRIVPILGAITGGEETDSVSCKALIELLKEAVAPNTISRILPHLYTLLLSRDQATRAAAIGLWRSCARAAKTLPDELTELIPTLLRDRYIIVHSEMAAAIPYLELKDDVAAELLDRLAAIAQWHGANGGPGIAKTALSSLLWAARWSGAETKDYVAAFAFRLLPSIDAVDRENILLDQGLRDYRHTHEWASAAIDLFGDPRRVDVVVSPRNDRLLEALLEHPNGVESIDFDIFRAIVQMSVPGSLSRAAELMELLQASSRWMEAERLSAEALALIPSTEEYRSRRNWFQLIHDAAKSESSIHQDRPIIQENVARLNPEGSGLRAHIWGRAVVRDSLRTLPIDDPQTAADRLTQAADVLERTPGGDTRVALFVEGVRIVSRLVRYDIAVRQGDINQANGLLAAAKRAATLMHQGSLNLSESDPIRSFSAFAADMSSDQLDSALLMFTKIPLALPLCDSALRWPRRKDRSEPKSSPGAKNVEPTPLAVCGVSVNGRPVYDVQVLRDNQVHDLTVDLWLPRWPAGAKLCCVQFLTTLSAEVLAPPTFSFELAEGRTSERGLHFSKTQHMAFQVKRPAGSKPLRLPVHVQFLSEGQTTVGELGGLQRLEVAPFDASLHVTKHAQADQRLLKMFADLHDDAMLDDGDIAAFCRFFGACVSAAQGIVFDKTFRSGTNITEKQFHDEFEERLKSDPALEGRLSRRDAVAGGFDDLLHDDIIAELKVEKKTTRSPDDCARYIGQPTQYGVGRGSRLSILVVLDHTKKSAPPVVLENNIGWLFPRQHGLRDPQYPSRVGVLVIATNWPIPSAWSRRRIETREGP
jgi:hypothetical protein